MDHYESDGKSVNRKMRSIKYTASQVGAKRISLSHPLYPVVNEHYTGEETKGGLALKSLSLDVQVVKVSFFTNYLLHRHTGAVYQEQSPSGVPPQVHLWH